MMRAVSSKIPCDRDGQNSIGQALPETFACKTRRRERGKCPLLNAFQVIYCLLRRQGLKNRNSICQKSPGSLYAFQVICCLKNWNSIFISTPYPAGIKPY